jgi:hypothetical protein
MPGLHSAAKLAERRRRAFERGYLKVSHVSSSGPCKLVEVPVEVAKHRCNRLSCWADEDDDGDVWDTSGVDPWSDAAGKLGAVPLVEAQPRSCADNVFEILDDDGELNGEIRFIKDNSVHAPVEWQNVVTNMQKLIDSLNGTIAVLVSELDGWRSIWARPSSDYTRNTSLCGELPARMPDVEAQQMRQETDDKFKAMHDSFKVSYHEFLQAAVDQTRTLCNASVDIIWGKVEELLKIVQGRNDAKLAAFSERIATLESQCPDDVVVAAVCAPHAQPVPSVAGTCVEERGSPRADLLVDDPSLPDALDVLAPCPGDYVRLHGLSSPGLNGKPGTVVEIIPASQRYGVLLHGDKTPKAIKFANVVTYEPRPGDVCYDCAAPLNLFAFPPCACGRTIGDDSHLQESTDSDTTDVRLDPEASAIFATTPMSGVAHFVDFPNPADLAIAEEGFHL